MSLINIMATRHSAFYSPLLMTMAGGFLKSEGLDYRYTLATPDNTVADNIALGTCQVAQSAVAVSFAALEAGQDNVFKHFAQINGRDGFFLAGRRDDADFSWQNLKGKSVLVDHFFQPLAMIKFGLHEQGVEFSDMHVIDAGDVDSIEKAFREGKGDYVHVQGPAAQQLVHDEVAKSIHAVGETLGPIAFSSLCADPAWLSTDDAKAFMRAYQNALKHTLNSSAVELAEQQQQAGFFTDIDSTVLAQTIADYQALNTWSEQIEIPRQSYEKLLSVFMYSGLISKPYDYEQMICEPPAL